MIKSIIVAIADNRAIGRDNQLLWHISEDLKYFKRVTSGHPVIMGRKTYESIGRPLPKRTNIVISRDYAAPEGVIVAKSIKEAYSIATLAAKEAEVPVDEIFVMGGGQIYAQALEDADRLYVTQVHISIEDADTFFPVIDSEVWAVKEGSELFTDPESGYEFEFIVYERRIRK